MAEEDEDSLDWSENQSRSPWRRRVLDITLAAICLLLTGFLMFMSVLLLRGCRR
jgi:hypothetical protein